MQEKEGQGSTSLFNRIMAGIIIALGVLVVAGFIIVSVRTPKTAELEDSSYFTKEKVYGKAEEIIALFETGDYAAIRNDYCNSEMAEQMTDAALAEAKTSLSQGWGSRVEIKSRDAFEVRQSGVYYAMVQIKVSYENVEAAYTIMFDVHMKLAGFSIE